MRTFLPQTSEEWALVHRAPNDGCTGVKDWFVDCCAVHDYFYRHGIHWLDGQPVTRAEADAALRDCIRERSQFGKYSPMAFWRWAAVRIAGRWFSYGRFA